MAAQALLENVVKGRGALLGPNDPSTLHTKFLLANVMEGPQGDLAGARELYEAVLQEGPVHKFPEVLPMAKRNLGRVLCKLASESQAKGGREEAAELWVKAGEMIEQSQDSKERNIWAALCRELPNESGPYGPAKMVAHLCLAQEAHLGQAHPMTLIAKGNVVACVRMQGEWGLSRTHSGIMRGITTSFYIQD